jgi:hypothetical protein
MLSPMKGAREAKERRGVRYVRVTESRADKVCELGEVSSNSEVLIVECGLTSGVGRNVTTYA